MSEHGARNPFRARRVSVTLGALVALFAATSMASTPAQYAVDQAKSSLTFVGKQDGEPFESKFGKFRANVVFSPDDLAGSKLDVTVDTRSLDSGDDDRDGAIRNADLLFSQKYPESRFVSSSIVAKSAGQFEALGKLTIRGATREVRLPFTWETKQEGAETVAWLKGQFEVKRLDYGVGQGDWQDTSVAANEVLIKYALRLVPGGAGQPQASR